MSNAKRGVISANQLFFILLVSRMYCLISWKYHTFNAFLLFELIASLALAGAVYLLAKYKNPLKSPVLLRLLGAVCLCLAAVDVVRFTSFVGAAAYPDVHVSVVAALLFSAVLYASLLGAEGLARFAPLCAFLLLFSVLICGALSVKTFALTNFYGAFFNGAYDLMGVLTALDIPLLYLYLSPKTEGAHGGALLSSTLLSYGASYALFALCVGVLGRAVYVYDYPVFSLFRRVTLGGTRIDILYTSTVLAGAFLRASLLLYCFRVSFFKRKIEV